MLIGSSFTTLQIVGRIQINQESCPKLYRSFLNRQRCILLTQSRLVLGKKTNKKNCYDTVFRVIKLCSFSFFNTTKLKAAMQQEASDTNRRRTIANNFRIWAPSWRPFPSCLNYIISAFQAKQKGDYASGCRKMCWRKHKSPSFDIAARKHVFVTHHYFN